MRRKPGRLRRRDAETVSLYRYVGTCAGVTHSVCIQTRPYLLGRTVSRMQEGQGWSQTRQTADKGGHRPGRPRPRKALCGVALLLCLPLMYPGRSKHETLRRFVVLYCDTRTSPARSCCVSLAACNAVSPCDHGFGCQALVRAHCPGWQVAHFWGQAIARPGSVHTYPFMHALDSWRCAGGVCHCHVCQVSCAHGCPVAHKQTHTVLDGKPSTFGCRHLPGVASCTHVHPCMALPPGNAQVVCATTICVNSGARMAVL